MKPPPTSSTVSTTMELQLNPQRGAWCMVVSLLCFTGNALLLKYLSSLRHVDPWVSLSFRAGVGLVLTLILFGRKGTGQLRLLRSFQTWLLASRGIIGAISTACYYLSIGPLGAGKATLISNTWCVFAAVFATFFLGEKLGWFKSAGIALTMVGLTLLTQLDLGSIATFGRYELMALASALMAAAVVIVIRQLTRTESSATIFASQCLYGLLLAVPFACMHQQTLNMIDLAFLIGAALCASIGQLAMTEGFRFLTVTMGAGSQMLIPVIISLASIGLFHESFTWLQALGGVLVLWGMFQTVVGRRR